MDNLNGSYFSSVLPFYFKLICKIQSQKVSDIHPWIKKRDNKERIRISLPSFPTSNSLPPQTTRTHQSLWLHSCFQVFFQQPYFHLLFTPITGTLTNTIQASGAPNTASSLLIPVRHEVINRWGSSIRDLCLSHPKPFLPIFYHHQLSSPLPNTCAHPPSRLSLLARLPGFIMINRSALSKDQRTKPVCRMPGSWAANGQGAETITPQGPEQLFFRKQVGVNPTWINAVHLKECINNSASREQTDFCYLSFVSFLFLFLSKGHQVENYGLFTGIFL